MRKLKFLMKTFQKTTIQALTLTDLCRNLITMAIMSQLKFYTIWLLRKPVDLGTTND